MNKTDKDMIIGLLSKEVGKAVKGWAAKNDVKEDVNVDAHMFTPSCYVDEVGVVHYGKLITVDIDIEGDDDDDF